MSNKLRFYQFFTTATIILCTLSTYATNPLILAKAKMDSVLNAQKANASSTMSGAFSMNGQETKTGEPYLATSEQFVAFICDAAKVDGISQWNESHKDLKGWKFFQPHYPTMAALCRGQVEYQLDSITTSLELQGSGIGFNTKRFDLSDQATRDWLQAHLVIKYIKFNRSPVYLYGVKYDFTTGKYVAHKEPGSADGWYYVLVTDNGDEFIIARVSCFNNGSIKQTFWLQAGFAEVVTDSTFGDAGYQGDDTQVQDEGDTDQGTDKTKTDYGKRTKADGSSTTTVGGTTSKKGNVTNTNTANVTINNYNYYGDTTAKTGRDGKDGRDGVDGRNGYDGQDGANGQNGGNNYQDGYTSYNPNYLAGYYYDGYVHHDMAAAYFASLPPSNGGWGFYNNGQYCITGNTRNGWFDPSGYRCYQYDPMAGLWRLISGVTQSWLTGLNFCGGYVNNNWCGPSNQVWNHNGCGNTYINTTNNYNYYDNHEPVDAAGGPLSGPTTGAGTVGGDPAVNGTVPAGNTNNGGPAVDGTTGKRENTQRSSNARRNSNVDQPTANAGRTPRQAERQAQQSAPRQEQRAAPQQSAPRQQQERQQPQQQQPARQRERVYTNVERPQQEQRQPQQQQIPQRETRNSEVQRQPQQQQLPRQNAQQPQQQRPAYQQPRQQPQQSAPRQQRSVPQQHQSPPQQRGSGYAQRQYSAPQQHSAPMQQQQRSGGARRF